MRSFGRSQLAVHPTKSISRLAYSTSGVPHIYPVTRQGTMSIATVAGLDGKMHGLHNRCAWSLQKYWLVSQRAGQIKRHLKWKCRYDSGCISSELGAVQHYFLFCHFQYPAYVVYLVMKQDIYMPHCLCCTTRRQHQRQHQHIVSWPSAQRYGIVSTASKYRTATTVTYISMVVHYKAKSLQTVP